MATTIEDKPIVKPSAPSFVSTLTNHPLGFWFIFWGELAERCSYYGMMSILARFISDGVGENIVPGLGLGDATSTTWMSLFIASCYFLPLLGGFLADQYLGKYRLIVIFSIPYILGHIVLSGETQTTTIIALGLLAMGSGVIKPNISTLMGLTYDQQRPGDEQLRSMAFGMFYMAINIGAALSTWIIPQIRDHYGYSAAFMCPAVLMAVSFLIFAIGKPFYAIEKIERKHSTPVERHEKMQTLLRVSGLFLVVMPWWAIFAQTHSTWVFFARDFTDLKLLGYTFSPEQFGVLNPVLIILLVPAFQLVWNTLAARGIHVRPTDKMLLGFILTLLTLAVMAAAGYLVGSYEEYRDEKNITRRIVDAGSRVTIWWEVLAFVLITMAEVLISVTGLELAFIAAPNSLKGFVTAMWLTTVGIANLFINAPVGRLYAYIGPGDYFALTGCVWVGVIVAFLVVARRFNRLAATHAIPQGEVQGDIAE